MKKIAILISLKRSIEVHLHRLETFLLYFYDAYEVNLWEKMSSRRTACSYRTNAFPEFHHFLKKRIDTAED